MRFLLFLPEEAHAGKRRMAARGWEGAWLILQEGETEMGWSGLLLEWVYSLCLRGGQTAREWLLSRVGELGPGHQRKNPPGPLFC